MRPSGYIRSVIPREITVTVYDLESAGEDLPDDDPDMVAGMERLRVLREQEDNVPELRQG